MALHVKSLAPAWRPLPAPRCRREVPVRASENRQTPSPSSRESEVLVRIRRAKRKVAQPEPAGPKPEPALASALPPPDAAYVVERLAAVAQAAATEEERAFVAAMRDTAQALPALVTPPPVVGTSPAAVRARLAKAQEYKAAKARAAAGAAPLAEPAPLMAADSSAAQAAKAKAAAKGGALPALPAVPAPTEAAAAGGSAVQAAGFLRDVLSGGSAAAGAEQLSPEQFTLRREAAARSRGAELITIDAAPQGTAEGPSDAAYRPKVATWGVFPRPANISREFGGGRTLRPGEALEPVDVREARRMRVAAAMANYRQEQGLTVDAAVAAAAEAALAAGMESMKAGCLAEALALFCQAGTDVPLRSKLGGEATLQRAVCLDSMGRSAEAKALYQTVEWHPAPGIAKKARQMLFGFQAMDNLKTHTISYGVGSAYDSYFMRLSGQWASYVAPEGTDERGGVQTLVATALLLAPLLAVGAKIGGRLLAK